MKNIIKRFKEQNMNESNSYISNDEFEKMKDDSLIKIDELLDIYNDITININSSKWRTSSTYYMNLKNMKDFISDLKLIDDEYISNVLVKKDYMEWYKKKYPDRYKARNYNI